MLSTIALVLVATGIGLGLSQPRIGLQVLLIVSVCASLPWQLGGPNLEAPLLLGLGFVPAALVRLRPWHDLRTTRASVEAPIVRAAHALMAMLVQRGVVELSRSARTTPELTATLAGVWPELAVFNPSGPAGSVRAWLVLGLGIGVFCIALHEARRTQAHGRVRATMVVCAAIAVASPALQWLLGLSLYPRPGLGYADGYALVGFFQDFHGYAAFLTLLVPALLASAFVARTTRTRVAWALLALAAVACLVGTTSRSSLAVSVLGVLALLTVLPLLSALAAPRRTLLAILPAAVVVIVVVLLSSSDVRTTLYGQARAHLSWRFWQPFEEGSSLLGSQSWQSRQFLWAKGVDLVAHDPMWGAGPGQFRLAAFAPPATPIPPAWIAENAHSYFLQTAAEFGLPVAAALVLLLGIVLRIEIGGIRRARDVRARVRTAGETVGQVAFVMLGLTAHPLLLGELQFLFWTSCALTVGWCVRRSRARRSAEARRSP